MGKYYTLCIKRGILMDPLTQYRLTKGTMLDWYCKSLNWLNCIKCLELNWIQLLSSRWKSA